MQTRVLMMAGLSAAAFAAGCGGEKTTQISDKIPGPSLHREIPPSVQKDIDSLAENAVASMVNRTKDELPDMDSSLGTDTFNRPVISTLPNYQSTGVTLMQTMDIHGNMGYTRRYSELKLTAQYDDVKPKTAKPKIFRHFKLDRFHETYKVDKNGRPILNKDGDPKTLSSHDLVVDLAKDKRGHWQVTKSVDYDDNTAKTKREAKADIAIARHLLNHLLHVSK